MRCDRDTLLALRTRLAALRAPACGMAHESVRSTPDGRPVRSTQSATGYARPGICPAAVRNGHLGCSHTTARHVLRDALACLPDAHSALLRELDELENNIGLLDHRRYDAETGLARAIDDEHPAETAAARRAIDELVGEHRGYAARALALRDDILARLDATLASAGSAGHISETAPPGDGGRTNAGLWK